MHRTIPLDNLEFCCVTCRFTLANKREQGGKRLKKGPARASGSRSNSGESFDNLLGDVQPMLDAGMRKQDQFYKDMLENSRSQLEQGRETMVILKGMQEGLKAMQDGATKQTEILASLAVIFAKQAQA